MDAANLPIDARENWTAGQPGHATRWPTTSAKTTGALSAPTQPGLPV